MFSCHITIISQVIEKKVIEFITRVENIILLCEILLAEGEKV